jgi:hypothetical protein
VADRNSLDWSSFLFSIGYQEFNNHNRFCREAK